VLYIFQGDEISHLVASQPSAAMAVRLEALLPIKKQPYSMADPLDKVSVGCFAIFFMNTLEYWQNANDLPAA